ncbi:hypothetical protein BGZ70_008772 [Mortierella alpina]|uniref:Cas12f1-like TNB domain-containing protein n=1 Tax=Mortierella alpina TaxID=64518 RepID=A0A9P6M5V7_MORAP|nr:hypothetical protein BGZ70_008772 [Mortierella alpina]
MGLHGFFQFLAESNILGQRMSAEETKNHAVELDLFGCYYYLIKHWLVEEDMRNLKRARQLQHFQQQQPNLPRLYLSEDDPCKLMPVPPPASAQPPVVYALHRTLLKNFSPDHTRIHAGDTTATTQKNVGLEDRVKQKNTNLQQLTAAVGQLEGLQKRKRRAAFAADGLPAIRDSDVARIIAGLEELGWQVCACPGESDVCAARHLCAIDAVPASVDSDLFLHSTVDRVLRKVGRSGFFQYAVDDVRRKLKLSELQFLVLGMVSRSDYAKNAPNMGLKRNCKAIQLLKAPALPNGYLRNLTILHRLLQVQALPLCQDNAAESESPLSSLRDVIEVALYYIAQIQDSFESEEAPASEEEDTVMEAAEAESQWKSPEETIASMRSQLTNVMSMLGRQLEAQPLSTVIDNDTAMTIQRSVFHAEALLKEAKNILEQLLKDYKKAVKTNVDTKAGKDGIEKQYEVYLDRLDLVVPMGLDEPSADHAETSELSRPFPKKTYAAHVVDLTKAQGGAPASVSPQPPPGPPSPSPGGSKAKPKQKPKQQPKEPPKRKLSQKQIAAQQAREEKKKEKEAKKLAAKKEKEAKKLEAKKEREAKKLEAKKQREDERKKEKEAKRKAQPLKRSSKKMKYNKSSRGARAAKTGGIIPTPEKAEKDKRKLGEATKTRDTLKKKHGVVTLETGSIRGLLAENVRVAHKLYSQKHNLDGASVTDLDNISGRIEQTLEQVVDFMNNSRRWIHLTIDLLIAMEVKNAEGLGADHESTVLIALIDPKKCQKIVGRIGIYLRMSWDELVALDEELPPREATDQPQQEDVEIEPTEETEDPPEPEDAEMKPTEETEDLPESEDVEMSVADPSEARSPEASETGSPQPSSEDESQRDSDDEGQQDPEAEPEAEPEGQHQQDAAVDPSKDHWHERVALDAVMDMYHSLGLMASDAILPKPPCTVNTVYYTMAREIADEIGQFYCRLEFELLLKVNDFHRRQDVEEREEHSEQKDKIGLWFRRNLMLPKGERFKLYPQVGLQESFVTFSEHGLREVLWARGGETTPLMKRFFGESDDALDLTFHLFVHHTNHARRTMPLHEYMRLSNMPAENLTDGQKRLLVKKFQVATGTFRTNGRVVQALASNTKHKAKKTDKRGAVAAKTSPQQPSKSDEASASQQTATAPKRKSVLDDIPYLHKWLAVPANRTKHFPVRPGNATGTAQISVIGIDLGVVVPCAVAALYAPSQGHEVVNAIVTQRSMYEPSNRFARSLQPSKSKPVNSDNLRYDRPAMVRESFGPVALPSISEYESSIPDRQSNEPEDVVKYAKWLQVHQLALLSFYQSAGFKRKQWANRRAMRAEYEQVLNVVLRTIGLRTGDVQRHTVLDVVVVLGDGQFEGVRGRSSFHEKAAEFLYKKLTALGIPVVKVDEYKTSSVCPRCDAAVRKEMRRVTCTACNVPMHRDSAGAHNIARIGMAHILGQPRPMSLRRPTQSQSAAQPTTAAEVAAQAEQDVEGDFGLD